MPININNIFILHYITLNTGEKIMKKLNLLLIGGFLVLFIASCTNYPEQLSIKDTFDLKESIPDILKNEYGLFINKAVKISSTADFNNLKLVLIGETEPNMDIRLVTLGMKKTNKLLFNKLVYIQISDNMSNADKDKPCATLNENLSINGNELPCVREIYSKNAELSTIFEKSLNSIDCVFLTKKANSKKYSNMLNELIVK
jgi:hypothetical protein